MKWIGGPGMHHDRLWVAREGGAIVGMSVLDYPPGVGNVWTDYTGTSRAVRGRGIARALKCETVTQAIALGVTHVRDRKSTRLNSSHQIISYAVFCLKKKNHLHH